MRGLCLILISSILVSCNKDLAPTNNCFQKSGKFVLNAPNDVEVKLGGDGYIYDINFIGNKASLMYKMGNLESYGAEKFFYTNGILNKVLFERDSINFFSSENKIDSLHYFDTRTNSKISTKISYDLNGNIKRVNIHVNEIFFYNVEYSEFSGHKHPFYIAKGWPIDVSVYNTTYYYFENFYLNPDGMPEHATVTNKNGESLNIDFLVKIDDQERVIEITRMIEGIDLPERIEYFTYYKCD